MMSKLSSTTSKSLSFLDFKNSFWLLFQEKFADLGLSEYSEWIHFGLTSQDINNTAIPLLLKGTLFLLLFCFLFTFLPSSWLLFHWHSWHRRSGESVSSKSPCAFEWHPHKGCGYFTFWISLFITFSSLFLPFRVDGSPYACSHSRTAGNSHPVSLFLSLFIVFISIFSPCFKLRWNVKRDGMTDESDRVGKEMMVFVERLHNVCEDFQTHRYLAKFGGFRRKLQGKRKVYIPFQVRREDSMRTSLLFRLWIGWSLLMGLSRSWFVRDDFEKFPFSHSLHFRASRDLSSPPKSRTTMTFHVFLISCLDFFLIRPSVSLSSPHFRKRVNVVLEDFSKDMWTYISLDYFKQKYQSEFGAFYDFKFFLKNCWGRSWVINNAT